MNPISSGTNANLTRRDFIKAAGLGGAGLAVLPGATLQGAEAGGKKLVMALVGGAHIHTPNYVNILKGRADVSVKYVWDHDLARAAKWAKVLGARVVDDDGHIWNDREVVGVVICSETDRHHGLVLAAAQAGKHMFVEKPLGVNSQESYAMAAAIEKAGVLFTTGYFMRTQPHILFLKQQVEQANFGKITRVQGSNCHNGSLGGWFDTDWRWMADPKIAGVGAFGDLGTHSLDILMWLCGGIASVAADIKIVTGRYPGCDESGEALMKFKNGVTGTLAAGWVDLAEPVPLLISGTEGHAVVFQDQLYYRTNKVLGADGKAPWTQLPAALPPPMEMFVNAVAGQPGMALVSPAEAAARVSVMEAMYHAAHDHRWAKPA